MRRAKRLVAIAAGLALVVACRDEGPPAGTVAPTVAPTAAPDATPDTAGGGDLPIDGATDTTTAGPARDDRRTMRMTLQLHPDAVWDDGTPITIDDLQCTLDAVLDTPGSRTQDGYTAITAITEGDDEGEIVMAFSEPYAAYKDLFPFILKADVFADCTDVSNDLGTALPFSARPYKLESWSPEQAVLVANGAYWGDLPLAQRVVIVPGGEAALLAGTVDFVFRESAAGLADALATDPTISLVAQGGADYEGLYFQQQDGPLADDDFRRAFATSIDRELIRASIYDPILPGGPLQNCGLWVPTIGPWCGAAVFGAADGSDGFFDPAAADQILPAAGWVRNEEGFWAKDGVVPTIRWMINTPDRRREDTQALLMPELAAAGFHVVADNCNSACVFQQRLPALDYDLGMYINSARPDPSVTASMSCDAVPSEDNGNTGRNSSGWCSEAASALMTASDETLDVDQRADLIDQIAGFLAVDAVMLPLYQFPNVAAWNTTRLGGPVDQDVGNVRAWQNIDQWVDLDGDGQIVIGAERWPPCLNPVTECANSTWYQWTVGSKVLPSLWDTTATGEYVPSAILAGEPEVVVGG